MNQNLKKGDKAYIIEDSIIIECTIEKITTEDKIKNVSSSDPRTYRKPKFTVDPSYGNTSNYPEQFAFISYLTNNGLTKKWRELDSIKKDPKEFINYFG